MRAFLTLAMVACGCFTGCTPVRHNLPPACSVRWSPGPGVGGPGPEYWQVAWSRNGPGGPGMGGVVPASCVACAGDGGGAPGMGGMMRWRLGCQSPSAIQSARRYAAFYDVAGDGSFGSEPLYVPGASPEFPGGIYRMKLTNIQGREGVELYPTIEVANGNPRTAAYLAHNAIPVQFTTDDFEQVLSGNFVTKVIYLPDPEFQGDALVGVDVLVSNRLEPGLDPIVEADRRGSILAIVRVGNKDIELSVSAKADGYDGWHAHDVRSRWLPGLLRWRTCIVAWLCGRCYSTRVWHDLHGYSDWTAWSSSHSTRFARAGLMSHTMRNRTSMNIPDPVKNVKINVRQTPGQSYPQPVSRVNIHERNIHPGVPTMSLHTIAASRYTGCFGCSLLPPE
ncbi:MAG: hypothetical protein R3C56_02195 [Pirellulaceae bacterium]